MACWHNVGHPHHVAVLLSCVVCSKYHIPFVSSDLVRSNFTFLSITHLNPLDMSCLKTCEHSELFSQTLSLISLLEERSGKTWSLQCSS